METVQRKVADAPLVTVAVVLFKASFAMVALPLKIVHFPVSNTEGVFAANVKERLLQALISSPAKAMGSSKRKTTSSAAVQVGSAMRLKVHFKVAVVPVFKIAIVVGLEGLFKVTSPFTTVQVPIVPEPAACAPKINVRFLHCLWSSPADDLTSITVKTISSLAKQVCLSSTVTVQRKVATVFVLILTVVKGLFTSVIVASPLNSVHLPVMPKGAALATIVKLRSWQLLMSLPALAFGSSTRKVTSSAALQSALPVMLKVHFKVATLPVLIIAVELGFVSSLKSTSPLMTVHLPVVPTGISPAPKANARLLHCLASGPADEATSMVVKITSSAIKQVGLSSTETVQRNFTVEPESIVTPVVGLLMSAIVPLPLTKVHLPVMPKGATFAPIVKLRILHFV